MARDELYIVDLCDRVIGMTATRQLRFAFHLGDPGLGAARRRLPVDAFHPALILRTKLIAIGQTGRHSMQNNGGS